MMTLEASNSLLTSRMILGTARRNFTRFVLGITLADYAFFSFSGSCRRNFEKMGGY